MRDEGVDLFKLPCVRGFVTTQVMSLFRTRYDFNVCYLSNRVVVVTVFQSRGRERGFPPLGQIP